MCVYRRSWGCLLPMSQVKRAAAATLVLAVGLIQWSVSCLWLVLNMVIICSCSLARDASCCSSALLRWQGAEYTGRGKGKPWGISCFHFSLHLLCPYPVRQGQPFGCRAKLCLGWQVVGLCYWDERESCEAAHFLFHLLPLQRGGPLHLRSSSNYPAAFLWGYFQISIVFALLMCLVLMKQKNYWELSSGALRHRSELLYVSYILPVRTVLYVPYILFSCSSRCSVPP